MKVSYWYIFPNINKKYSSVEKATKSDTIYHGGSVQFQQFKGWE